MAASESAVRSIVTPCAWMSPSASEWIVAASKLGQPNWGALQHPPVPTKSTSRTQIAFFIGLNLAHAHLAAAEGDTRSLSNTTRDILLLSESLGIADKLAPRMKAVIAAADTGNRVSTAGELDNLLQVVCSTLHAQHDQPIEMFIHLGVFAASLHTITNPALGLQTLPAPLLNLSDIVAWFDSALRDLPEPAAGDKVTSEALVFTGRLASTMKLELQSPRDGELARLIFEQTGQLIDTLCRREF